MWSGLEAGRRQSVLLLLPASQAVLAVLVLTVPPGLQSVACSCGLERQTHAAHLQVHGQYMHSMHEFTCHMQKLLLLMCLLSAFDVCW